MMPVTPAVLLSISKHIHINNNNNKRKIETSEVT